MLLSNRFKFLFVHIAKTGGTSLRAALGRLCWRDPLYLPQFLCHRLSHLSGHRIGAKLPRHAAVIAAQELLRPSLFDALFKFAIARNPWDRQVSCYHHFLREQPWLLKANRLGDFHDFTRWLLEDAQDYRGPKQVLIAALRRPQFEYLIDLRGAVIVDFVGRYESLQDDYQQICQRIGVAAPALPHKRKAAGRADYRSYYVDTTAEMVARHFRADVNHFGYHFDPSTADADSQVNNREPSDSIRLLRYDDPAASIPFRSSHSMARCDRWRSPEAPAGQEDEGRC
jgi:hypothetical protein